MTLATFFEKFDTLADAPNAVAKMRELVLELSATGRLIPEALEWPVEEDTQLMGSIVELVMGQAPAGHECNNEGKGTIFVKVGEFGTLYPEKTVWTTKPLKFAKSGDVLVCVVGATVGKINLAIDCAIGRSVAAIRPSNVLETKFLYYSLIPYTLRLRRNSRGSAQGVIGKAELNAISLWIPSIGVQKRIVSKVDELMALCDRLEVQQQERQTRHADLARASLACFAAAPTPANLHFLFHKSYTIPPADLRKSILTLAVQGKLVPQDPKDEPAMKFLAIIQRGLKKAKVDSENGVNSDEEDSSKPFNLPPGWAWSRFSQLGEFGRGKSKHRPRNDHSLFVGGNHRLVQTGDVARANGTIETHTGLYNDVGLAQSKMWPSGTLCITIAANIADSGILGFDACFPDSVVGFIPAKPIPSVRYFEYFMRTAKENLNKFAPSTAQKNINLGILEQVWIPIPPLAEQRRIVAKVDQLMALVDELETHLAASRATAKNLLEAIVGELTSTH